MAAKKRHRTSRTKRVKVNLRQSRHDAMVDILTVGGVVVGEAWFLGRGEGYRIFLHDPKTGKRRSGEAASRSAVRAAVSKALSPGSLG